MSLLDTASLIVTPNGYKASKLYSVKPTDASGDMVVTRNTTATRVNSAGLIESVAFNAPRIDYTNASCPSILVEPLRTNLVTYSNNFTDASWTKSSATLTPNFGISPDGTQNSTKINFEINAQLYKLIGTTSNAVSSIYIKGVNGETIQFFNNQTNAYITRTLNGTWQRFVDIAIGTTFSYVAIGTLAGVTARVVEVYGAQLEEGSNATSYIPTTTATVTRNADVITKTGITSLIGQTEGTLYAEFNNTLMTYAVTGYVMRIFADANNEVFIRKESTTSSYTARWRANGTNVYTQFSIAVLNGNNKIAIAYKSTDSAVYLNGTQIGTSAGTGAFSVAPSQISIGSSSTIDFFNDRIELATLFPTRLTNAQLATLTAI